MIERIEALRKNIRNHSDYEQGWDDGIDAALAMVREHLDAAPTVEVKRYDDERPNAPGFLVGDMVGNTRTAPEMAAGTYRLLKEGP